MNESGHDRRAGHETKDRKTCFVRLLGAAAVGAGAWGLLTPLDTVRSIMSPYITGRGPECDLGFALYSLLLSSVFMLPAIGEIVGGGGLVMRRDWARSVAAAAFALNFALNFITVVTMMVQYYLYHDTFAMLRLSEAEADVRAGMWPTYVTALVSLLFLALLSRESVKRALAPSTPSPNLKEDAR